MTWGWRPSTAERKAAAAVAWGDVATSLHARIATFSAAEQERLQATASRHGLIICGEESALPWVEGVGYAAPCLQAPGLWVSTLEEPDVPADLLHMALVRRCEPGPLLLWRRPLILLSLGGLCRVSDMDWSAWANLWRER